MTEKHLTNQSFNEFDLPDSLLKGIRETGFEWCTPIQAEALPPALAGQDVAGQAQTGTGKTAAFLIAVYNHLYHHPAPSARTETQPRALILAPTRELAIQIHRDAESLGRHMPFKLALAYGGTGYEKQRSALAGGVDVLIGTPGRLIDYFKQKVFDLRAIQVVVLDEADRMFDLGFIRDIRYFFRRMPPPEKRLSMLFSATLSLRVNELAYEHMNNPLVVKIESERLTVDRVTETVYFPSNEEKIPLLLRLLKASDSVRTLIFVNTKHGTEIIDAWLRGNDCTTGVLSGNVPQRKRERLLQDFKDGKVPILVATDVAARGLHIPDVSHVINYDLPQDPEDYVHRVGRTARAGASGDAISFACETYAFSLVDIEEYLGHKIPVRSVSAPLLTKPKPPARFTSGSRRTAPASRRDAGAKKTRHSRAGDYRHAKSPHKDQQSKRQDSKAADAGQPRSKATKRKSKPATTTRSETPAKRRSPPEPPAVG